MKKKKRNRNSIKIECVPGHKGIIGNDTTDELEGKAQMYGSIPAERVPKNLKTESGRSEIAHKIQ